MNFDVTGIRINHILSQKYATVNEFVCPRCHVITVYNVIFYHFFTHNKGNVRDTPSGCGRCILASFLIIALVIMGTYSGNQMAFLAVSKGQLPFYTLQEAADDTTHILQIGNGTVAHLLFSVSQKQVSRALAQGQS